MVTPAKLTKDWSGYKGKLSERWNKKSTESFVLKSYGHPFSNIIMDLNAGLGGTSFFKGNPLP